MSSGAGALNCRVTIEHDTGTSRDAANHVIPSWVTYKTRWAEILTKGSQEVFHASRVHGDITHVLRVRSGDLDGVTTKMRVNYKGRYLNIAGPPMPDREGKRTRLLIPCKEVA